MADPITREQVERAIEAARSDEGGISDALGGWQWDKRAPDYVRVAWGKPSLPDFIAALTRWHAELVAAETPRKAPDHTAPERLRERGEGLGGNQTWAAEDTNRPHGYTEDPWGWRCVASCEDGSASAIDRARYAAALSAAEAERADKPDHLAYADSPVWDDGPLPTPTPERPAPRFKVGDWVRVCGTYATHRGTAYQIVEIVEGWHRSKAGSGECSYAETELEPASPPAPEVVDVPQPAAPVVKRCDTVTASWTPGKGHLTVRTMVRDMDVPIALLRAMLEAIDAQQGGAS